MYIYNNEKAATLRNASHDLYRHVRLTYMFLSTLLFKYRSLLIFHRFLLYRHVRLPYMSLSTLHESLLI